MIFTETRLKGAFIIDLRKLSDDRGFFARAWCIKEFEENGLNTQNAQSNIGFNPRKGTLRGLHYQVAPYAEAKLIRCTMGAMYDVIVDLRENSSTYKQWISVELTDDNHRMLYVPEGFAQGYLTLKDNTEMFYQASQFFYPESARGVRYNDPTLKFDWPIQIQLISEKDQSWPDFQF